MNSNNRRVQFDKQTDYCESNKENNRPINQDEIISKLQEENANLWREIESRDNYIAQLTLMNNQYERRISSLEEELGHNYGKKKKEKSKLDITVETDDEYQILLNKFNKLQDRYNKIYKKFNNFLNETSNIVKSDDKSEEVSLDIKQQVSHLRHIIHLQHSMITASYKDMQDDKHFISCLANHFLK